MKILLDTHTFLWLAIKPDLLSKNAIKSLENIENDLYLSSISIWEIEQKYQIGKLALPSSPKPIIKEFCNTYQILSLGFDAESAFELQNLPKIHNDPFDRMLICQAISHKFAIATNDRFIKQYKVRTIW